MKNTTLLVMLSAISLALVAGCATVQTQTEPQGTTVTTKVQVLPEGVNKFADVGELIEYLEKSGTGPGYTSFSSRGAVMMEGLAMDSGAAKAAPQAFGATEYSETNIQVAGVDEADIVKNDGKYIYMVNQDDLVIINAYPAQDAEVVFQDELTGRPRNLFVNSDRLVVFTEDDDEVFGISPYDYMPRPRQVRQTEVLLYNISDRENPRLIGQYSMTGEYFESRMIGDYVYFVVRDYVYYYNHYVDVPLLRTAEGVAARPEIYYFDDTGDNHVFHTVSALNMESGSASAETYLLGHSSTMYMSQKNLYIAYEKSYPWRIDNRKERFFEAVVPLLPADVQKEIRQIQLDTDRDYELWAKVSEVMEDMYRSMDGDDAEDLVEDISEAVEKWEILQEEERRKTVIHKVAIDRDKIRYSSAGEVSGSLLNQFSLDEHNGNLRVATTTYAYTSQGSRMHNNVYVLDSDMEVKGELEKIAPDERIYSTRFIGNRLYMVTFKRIDPLFVISLADPRNPKILGELKIPGFSDYLHPYDDDHIIGIGKETAENEWGGVSVKGVKLALFDVSDVKKPKLLDQYEIGDHGTDSEALRDHKAFLFDREKNLLVLPIREVKERSSWEYGRSQKVWQGAYVFGLTPRDGFVLRGKITHQDGLEKYYYYYTGNAVRRALYMDDVLYTVSGKKVKMNSIPHLDEVNEIKLSYDQDRWYWY